ncbi:EF-hand domain-containing protein [Roseimaritima ulvae]|uniref:EF hand n=1 Tax=Roseimaritima ulvae TaxID=980254 RepID=A0A5B9QR22_9BACT|nr:EF-hand domain-containing protein [Roseimaritima ulvae]QEG41444.1 EF hand [Roseimaritima ulvae]
MKLHILLSLTLVSLLALTAEAQPPGGGGDRGGRGGDRGGGGGDRGGRGGGGDRGGRGGFDPSQMLSRLDRNGNGMLDMDERQGPASFIVSRMQRENPNLKVDRPIPIKDIGDAFNRMRGGQPSGDSGSQGGDSPSALEAEMLVPGFGVEEPLAPVPGFGSTAEMFDVEIREEDKREAEERMRRYDRNKDGFLNSNELSSRWEGNPMDFDRNRDGKLSVAELTVRYARRREGSAAATTARRDTRNDRDRGRRDRDDEPEDPYNGAKSFRNLGLAMASDDLPDLFQDKDVNGDQQIEMSEFASEWNQEKVEEFYALDRNGDGTITLAEFQRPSSGGGESDSSKPAMQTASSSGASSSRGASSSSASQSDDAERSAKYVAYSKRIIARYDNNKDGALQEAEWKKMLIDPSPADTNRDGKITADEYTSYLLQKAKK